MPSFIDDGYQFLAGIDPIEYSHDGIEFVYRPCTPEESSQYFLDVESKSKGKDKRRVQARWLLKKLVLWRAPKKSDWACPELSEDNLDVFVGDGNFINSRLLSQIIAIVFFGESPDYGDEYQPENLEKNSVKASS